MEKNKCFRDFFILGKKAQIGTTISWVPSMVIIFFILLIFLIAMASISLKDIKGEGGVGAGISAENAPEVSGGYRSLYLQRRFYSFLNSEIEYEQTNITVKYFLKKEILENGFKRLRDGMGGGKSEIESKMINKFKSVSDFDNFFDNSESFLRLIINDIVKDRKKEDDLMTYFKGFGKECYDDKVDSGNQINYFFNFVFITDSENREVLRYKNPFRININFYKCSGF